MFQVDDSERRRHIEDEPWLLTHQPGFGDGAIHKAANRRLEIEGSHNLRDLGGIEVRRGRTVRRGLVFRSGSLERLTPSGISDLLALGIATIFDFRSGPERKHSPNRWIADQDVACWQLDASESLGDPRALLEESLQSADRTHAMMCNVYRDLPQHHRQCFAALFQSLAREQRPVLFHCAAGKDRTGVASALLLALLGVDRPEIEADYLATNEVIEATTQMFLSDPRNAAVRTAPSGTWQPMMAADPAFLDAMFQELYREHGSVEAYVREALHLTPAEIHRLRERLLD